jgi:hypothetical protein
MTPDERRLTRHLVLAVAVKLALLAGLWWAFVGDFRVAVDADTAAAQLGSTPPTPGAPR